MVTYFARKAGAHAACWCSNRSPTSRFAPKVALNQISSEGVWIRGSHSAYSNVLIGAACMWPSQATRTDRYGSHLR